MRFGKYVLTKKKKPWEQFEEEVLLFARHALKLDNLNGGPACRIAGCQLDVVGGLEDRLLVFECKSKNQVGKRSLRADLRALWVKKREISQVIRKRYAGKYAFTKFIMVLRGISPSEADLEYAARKKIVVWTEPYFDSVRALYLTIGDRVRFYVLKELGGRPPRVATGSGAYFEVPAMAADYYYFVKFNLTSILPEFSIPS
jgi:hypothetical protein